MARLDDLKQSPRLDVIPNKLDKYLVVDPFSVLVYLTIDLEEKEVLPFPGKLDLKAGDIFWNFGELGFTVIVDGEERPYQLVDPADMQNIVRFHVIQDPRNGHPMSLGRAEQLIGNAIQVRRGATTQDVARLMLDAGGELLKAGKSFSFTIDRAAETGAA